MCPRTTRLCSQSRPRLQLSNGYPKLISYLETKNFTFQPIIPLCSNSGLECDPKLRKCGPRTTRLHSQSRPRLQLSNGYPKLISYLETKNFTFQPIIPLRSNSGLECDPKLRKCGPRTTRLRSQSRPCLQLSNGYPKLISYLEMKNFTFQPIIPLRSNSGLECDPKLRKCTRRTTRLHSQSRPRLQLSNGYPKLISYLETKNFTFQPIIPLRSNSGLECDPKLRKCGRRTTRLRSQSRPRLQLSNGYPKLISYLEMKNFTFQPIIPLRSNSGLECDPKLRKCGPRTTRLRSQSRPRLQLSNGYPKLISYLETKNFTFQPIIPLRSNSGLECDPKLRKCGPRTTRLRSQSRPRLQLSNGYPKLISYLETKNFTFQPIIPLRSNSGLECDPKLRKCGPRTTRLRSQSRPRLQLSNGYPKLISYLETKNFTFQPIIPLHSNSGLECDPKLRKCGPRTTRLRSQSRPRLQLSNGYPKLISYLETKNFTFQPIIPLRSNSGLECDPKLRKCGPRTTHLHSQSRPRLQLSNGYPKLISYLEMEEFYFSTHNPTSFKLGPGM
jgi:hypothetical protein